MSATEEPAGAWPFRLPGPPPSGPAELVVHLVSHTHWDREWYATAEWFRRRLVVTVDRVLDLLAADPGWSFVLDGQAIVVEDYLSARPGRTGELTAAVTAGRLAIGPWYVQPDSLLPSGEAHVRNLLEGRLVCAAFGGSSRVAYTPDSFGHPAWFPTLLRGFDLTAFVYWRGHGAERDVLPARWWWRALDGSEILAWHLEGSYLAAATLEPDPVRAAARLHDLAAVLARRSPEHVVLMNGLDHSVPDAHTAAVVDALRATTGWGVHRTTLDAAVDAAGAGPAGSSAAPVAGSSAHPATGSSASSPAPVASWSGALLGARDANLLSGVWSSRLPIKLANRRLEAALWDAEHVCAVAALLGGGDERPTLRRIRRSMLENQAHDSIGGCSVDAVHREMAGRSASALAAASALTRSVAATLSGLGPDQLAPWSDEWEVAVWNPVPWPRRERVHIPVEGWPAFRVRAEGIERHPAHVASLDGRGFLIDGRAARQVDAEDPFRDRFTPEQRLVDLEAVVDLPALGWARVRVTRGADEPDQVGGGRDLELAGARVAVEDDGTLTYTAGGRTWSGLLQLIDVGDRGDTYDRDLLDDGHRLRLVDLEVERRLHTCGSGEVIVRRRYAVPAGLDQQRRQRVADETPLTVEAVVALAPDGRLDVEVTVSSDATDHAVRLRLPLDTDGLAYATQFGAGERGADLPTEQWVHAPPDAVCHQGWIATGGLLVVAPGLPEAVCTEGAVDLTVLRAVGWMSRPDLRTRPGRASPAIPVPEAQCDRVRARLAILPDPGRPAARWQALASVEQRPFAVVAGPSPIVEPGRAVLHVDGAVVTAVKPADDGDGVIVRLWNPADEDAVAHVGAIDALVATRCSLDEGRSAGLAPVPLPGRCALRPHEVVTLRVAGPG